MKDIVLTVDYIYNFTWNKNVEYKIKRNEPKPY